MNRRIIKLVSIMLSAALIAGLCSGCSFFQKKVKYVMVYNPEIYNDEEPYYPEETPDSTFDTRILKTKGNAPEFKVGDVHEFGAVETTLGAAISYDEEFKCIYSGDNCYIWTLKDDVPKATVKELGKEFDSVIYDGVTELFGEPRFVDNGRKVHILLHPIYYSKTMGYFARAEQTSSEGLSKEVIAELTNVDYAILHVNTLVYSDDSFITDDMDKDDIKEEVYAILAHEMQHMVNATDRYFNKNMTCSVDWIDETMSQYSLISLYPDNVLAEKYINDYNDCDLIKDGVSVYNYRNVKGSENLGIYGFEMIYSGYLSSIAGKDVFSKYHDYWRSETDAPSEAEALYNAVPTDVVKEIENRYEYPDKLKFNSKEERWLSKSTLDFYLSSLKYDEGEPEVFKEIKTEDMLFSGYIKPEIQGGGCIVYEAKKGKIDIPKDGGKPLVYIGLDENFEVTGDIIYDY